MIGDVRVIVFEKMRRQWWLCIHCSEGKDLTYHIVTTIGVPSHHVISRRTFVVFIALERDPIWRRNICVQ